MNVACRSTSIRAGNKVLLLKLAVDSGFVYYQRSRNILQSTFVAELSGIQYRYLSTVLCRLSFAGASTVTS